MADDQTRCPGCGADVPAAADRCGRCGADVPLEPIFLDDLPVARAIRTAVPRTQYRVPSRNDDDERPRPRVGLAILVMVGLTAAVLLGLCVIGYALVLGLRAAAKKRTAVGLSGAVVDRPAASAAEVRPGA